MSRTDFSGTPLPANVTCTAAATSDATQVTTTLERYCDAPIGCEEAVCDGTAPAGFNPCITMAGDVACPSGWATRTVVGDL